MARKTINNKQAGETGLSSRTKINENFIELYGVVDVSGGLNTGDETQQSIIDKLGNNTYQPYNQYTVVDSDYVHTDNNFTTIEKEKLETIEENAQQNVVLGTYTELKQLKDNEALIKGYTYIVTDFELIYNQPVTNIIMTGESEPLILTAISNNEFATECKSSVYKDDIIYYDFNDDLCEDGITPRKGWITGRKDLKYNNEVIGFDYKTCKFRRYKSNEVGIGVYDEGSIYERLDKVIYGSDYYICIKDTVVEGILPTNTSYFIKVFGVNDYVCIAPSPPLKVYVNSDVVTFSVNSSVYTDYYFMSDGNEIDYNIFDNYFNFINFGANNVYIGKIYGNYVSIGNMNFTNNTSINSVINNNEIIDSDFHNNIFINTVFEDRKLINSSFDNNMVIHSSINNTNTYSESISKNIISYSIIDSILINSSMKLNIINYSSIVYNKLYESSIDENIFIDKTFENNLIIRINNINYELATHVFANYNCELGINSNGNAYLKYTDEDNIIQTTVPTA